MFPDLPVEYYQAVGEQSKQEEEALPENLLKKIKELEERIIKLENRGKKLK